MGKPAQTFAALIESWKRDCESFDGKNTEDIAYSMTVTLAASDAWDELYDGNEKIARVFDIVADLELPPVHRSTTAKEADLIKEVKSLVAQLETEVKDESKKT